jgi:uncharacterized protein (DUF302 family)
MNTLKNLLSSLVTLVLLTTLSHAQITDENNTQSNALAVFYTVDGDIQDKYNTLVETKLKTIGFKLTDPHKRVNDQYETKYGSTVLDVLSFMPVVNDGVILPLLNIDPRIAGFAPFNMLIHKKLDENVTHVGHLQPKVMLDILDIKDKEVREKFTATFASLDAMIEKELGGKKTIMPYKKLPEQTMINYEYTFERPDDMDDFIDEFQNNFELAFIDKGYLIAGYHNFMESTDDAEDILADYDAFWTYSLCHLEFSYGMFDNAGARPEAGLFAPCTMYMYIKKGTNQLVVGMFRLHNWSDTLDITDEKRLTLVEKLDTEIPEILTTFGMTAIENSNTLLRKKVIVKKDTVQTELKEKAKTVEKTKQAQPTTTKPTKSTTKVQTIHTATGTVTIQLPKVPKPPKAIQLGNSVDTNRAIKFSKRVPPNYIPHRFDNMKKEKVSTNTRIGEVNHGRISAYLRGKFMEVKEVEEKLKDAGFTVLTSAPVNKKGTLISVVFTDKALLSMASKPNRGFMATLRVLVDTKEKTISITNPLYMTKGFLQGDYDEKAAKKLLVQIIETFPTLQNSKDVLKFQLLPKYQFMNGMPHYEDMIEVAVADDLLERIKDNKKVVFTQKLENGAVLIGIKLGKRTRKFTKRIGRNNAAMLPYPILIQDGKAKILDPKYYISYMYPLLKMTEFMTIATVPDAMVKDCERVFRKKKKK